MDLIKAYCFKSFIILYSLLLISCSIKPHILNPKQQYSHSLYPLHEVLATQQKLNGRISLEEAIARTIKYNLENRVAKAQTALEYGNFKLAVLEMLPKLPADLNYSFRNNDLIQNLVQDGEVTPGETSTTPREIKTVSLKN